MLQKGRQHQRPAQGQPGRRDVGVIKQAREPSRGIAPAADPPDDRPTQQFIGAAPAEHHLAKAGPQNRNGAGHQPQGNPAPGLRCGQIGLIGPERPEKRNPITQAHPGQPAAGGGEAAQEHPQTDASQQPIDPIVPPGRLLTTPQDQGHKQQQPRQKRTGRQQQQGDLEATPTPEGRRRRPLPIQQHQTGLQRLAPELGHSNTAVRPR